MRTRVYYQIFSWIGFLSATYSFGCGHSNPSENFGHIEVDIAIENSIVKDGLATFHFSLKESASIEKADFAIDGQSRGELQSLNGLYTISTRALNDGNHQAVFTVTTTDHRQGQAILQFNVENPTVGATHMDYDSWVYPQMNTKIQLTTEGNIKIVNADVSQLLGSPVPVLKALKSIGKNQYKLEFNMPQNSPAQEGWKSIPIYITGVDDRTARLPNVQVFLSKGPKLPLISEKAIFNDPSFPTSTLTKPSARITKSPEFLSVVTGEQTMLSVDLENATPDTQLLIGLNGMGGHLSVPVKVQTSGSTHLDIPLQLPMFSALQNNKGQWNVSMAVQDGAGNVSEPTQSTMAYGKVEKGNLHIRLQWDSPTDVDLHVIEPSGDVISYAIKESSTGGVLDLDSNAGCNIDNINHENIYWKTPPSGQYTVRVHYYDACNNLPANWKIDINGCGINQTKSGVFHSTGESYDAFQIPIDCNQFTVHGSAKYELESFQFNNSKGSLGTLTKELEGVKVRVVDSTQKELASGLVSNGEYNLVFKVPADQADKPVRLEFIPENEKVKVVKLFSNTTHVLKVAEWLPQKDPNATRNVLIKTDIVGPKSENTTVENPVSQEEYSKDVIAYPSGAFHIFTTILKGVNWIQAKNPSFPNPTVVQWTQGEELPGSSQAGPIKDQGAYYKGGNEDYIRLSGSGTLGQEFNDSVLLHELGHRVMDKLSLDGSPGGEHFIQRTSLPSLAWAEGFATYFGQRVLGNQKYTEYNRGKQRLFQMSLDSLIAVSDSPKGTEIDPNGIPNSPTGMNSPTHPISEAVIASILWNVQNQEASWFSVFFSEMRDPRFLAKGQAGLPDLADWAYLWGCSLPATSRNRLDTLMTATYNLPWLQTPGFCDTQIPQQDAGTPDSISQIPQDSDVLKTGSSDSSL